MKWLFVEKFRTFAGCSSAYYNLCNRTLGKLLLYNKYVTKTDKFINRAYRNNYILYYIHFEINGISCNLIG